MIRIRLQRGLTEQDLVETYGFKRQEAPAVPAEVYIKIIGQYEISVKLTSPTNIRIKDWPDSRAPWILFRFLLALEAKFDVNNKIKLQDSGYSRIMIVQDTLDLIRFLAKFTDLKHRLQFWYKKFLTGKLEINIT